MYKLIKFYFVDVYKAIYEKFIGQTVTLSPSNSIAMNLNDQKWVTLLKILSNFRLPEINYYNLNYIPADSEDVKTFMINSVPTQKYFYFNITKQVQIEGSKYIESLKEVARKTTDSLYVYNTNFSAHEFCEIVSAAKSCKQLYFYYDLIPFDYECDFSAEMGECKIEQIRLAYSGGSSYSNWSQNPARFENMVAAISRCEPLSKSLKTLNIGS